MRHRLEATRNAERLFTELREIMSANRDYYSQHHGLDDGCASGSTSRHLLEHPSSLCLHGTGQPQLNPSRTTRLLRGAASLRAQLAAWFVSTLALTLLQRLCRTLSTARMHVFPSGRKATKRVVSCRQRLLHNAMSHSDSCEGHVFVAWE